MIVISLCRGGDKQVYIGGFYWGFYSMTYAVLRMHIEPTSAGERESQEIRIGIGHTMGGGSPPVWICTFTYMHPIPFQCRIGIKSAPVCKHLKTNIFGFFYLGGN